jgi:hypothetical protein
VIDNHHLVRPMQKQEVSVQLSPVQPLVPIHRFDQRPRYQISQPRPPSMTPLCLSHKFLWWPHTYTTHTHTHSFFIHGGLVFTPLTQPYLQEVRRRPVIVVVAAVVLFRALTSIFSTAKTGTTAPRESCA